MSKTWCPLPWIFQAVRNNGDIRVCCQANPSKSKGLLKKNNGDTYNAASDNLEESRNSPTLKNIRLEMLKGEHPSACIRCQKEEASGILSRRMYENENWKKTFSIEKARQLTDKNGAINTAEIPLIYYDLRFGNRCNLKCRMCGPTDSDAWYSEYIKTWKTNMFQDSHGEVQLIKKSNGTYQTKNGDYDWIDSPGFWKQIKANAPNIKHIHTVGGEPLMIKKHYELLEAIINHGDPGNVTIEYNSNLTLLPAKALKLWKFFKSIKIGVSIDGYGSVNDYIRYPSRFKKIEKNLDQIDSSFNNITVWIATTVNAYNIFYLTNLIQWKLKKHFLKVNPESSDKPLLTTHPLHNPDYLNVKMLPKNYKIQIKEKFDHFLTSFPDWLKEEGFSKKQSEKLHFTAQKMLNGYVNYMNSEDWSHLVPKFWKYTHALDQIRKEKLQDVMPELHHSISNTRKDMNFC